MEVPVRNLQLFERLGNLYPASLWNSINRFTKGSPPLLEILDQEIPNHLKEARADFYSRSSFPAATLSYLFCVIDCRVNISRLLDTDKEIENAMKRAREQHNVSDLYTKSAKQVGLLCEIAQGLLK